jgi:putative tricarboxylic transport membrane protein
VGERTVTGVILLALGLLALLEAHRLAALREELVAGAVVGDDTLPRLVGLALLLVAAHVLLLARWPASRVPFPRGVQRKRMGASAGALVAYYVLAPLAGYTLSTLLVSTALYRTMGGYRWRVAALAGVATTLALYLMFRVWLLQPLPGGWLGI